MKVSEKHHGITEFSLEREEFLDMCIVLRGATISETMGPNWKDIYWWHGRPFVIIEEKYKPLTAKATKEEAK
jgi:hypothetical protein